MQEKLFVQQSPIFFPFFQWKNVNFFYSRINDRVGLGKIGSEAVGRVFEFPSYQRFSRFRIMTPPSSNPIIQKMFDTRTFLKHKELPPYQVFRNSGRKNFRPKNVIPLLLSIFFFHIRNFLNHRKVPHL